MNYRLLYRLLGMILLIEAGLLFLPLAVALYYGESIGPYIITIALLLLFSSIAILIPQKDKKLYAKEGFVCVGASWILMALFGALPFFISGAIPNYIDAFFECVSGLTTTGASILREVETLPRGILFWRSFTHWIGGMGVLVFMLAIIPADDGRAIYLLRAEVPGPTKGKIVPKIRRTALILYGIYMALTVIMIISLRICKMPWYDSIVNSFATAGTGGFSVKNASIAGYANPAAEWVIGAFMLIFGINFNLFYLIILGKFIDIIKNEELKVYLGTLAVAFCIITISTSSSGVSFEQTARQSFFQIASIISTTGFATCDFDLWPFLSKAVLFILMFSGACASSTAGGLKISRIVIIFKNAAREIKHMLRPRSYNVIKFEGDVVDEDTVKGCVNYLSIYITIFTLSFLLISHDLDGLSNGFESGITSVAACLNNVGPGFAAVGPTGNYADYSLFSKIVLSLDMLFGRLEILPMIILVNPQTWKKHL